MSLRESMPLSSSLWCLSVPSFKTVPPKRLNCCRVVSCRVVGGGAQRTRRACLYVCVCIDIYIYPQISLYLYLNGHLGGGGAIDEARELVRRKDTLGVAAEVGHREEVAVADQLQSCSHAPPPPIKGPLLFTGRLSLT
jgi:hypothetical protein